MSPTRQLMRGLLGRREPIIDGDLTVDGVHAPVTVRRDRFGIPHIEAGRDEDAWFGLGFCQAQDRTFQLETLLRVTRGTVAALVGPDGLPLDRLARRIGFHRAAVASFPDLDPQVAAVLSAFTRGINAGMWAGRRRRAHEFVLLRSKPSPWEPVDAAAMVMLQSFALASNWDVELARLEILLRDGGEALERLDPLYPEWQPVTTPPGTAAGKALDALATDIAAFREFTGLGGGSNNWALAPSRTATGRPLLANDPHLAPTLPPHWYLCHLSTPEWAMAGASFVGLPAIPAGHNGFAAWGVTAGLVDNTDLFVEQIGPDGTSVRRGDRFVRCEVRTELIEVRGESPVEERVLITDLGPVVGPAFDGDVGALSLKATWLHPAPLLGFLGVSRVRGYEEFRELFRQWPALSLNVAYADEEGTIGWLLAGDVPRRRRGMGTLPLPAWDPDVGWEDDPVPFEEMPHARDPGCGWIASANNCPTEGAEPFLGIDWIDGYRVTRIGEALSARTDWDVADTMVLQTDQTALPWREMRATVLAAAALRDDLAAIRDLLAGWDGVLDAGSAAAAVYEVFLAEMQQRVALAAAPASATRVLGKGYTPLVPYTLFALRRTGHLVALLRDQPEGWFERGWDAEIAEALLFAERRLRRLHGTDPGGWAWGAVRPLTLRHPLGVRAPLDRIFNLGPFPWGGDADTVAQASPDPADPTNGTTVAIGSMRMAIDVGRWERSRFSLPGGQSGNPASRHYRDLLRLWRKGDGVPIMWEPEHVAAATRHTLTLRPAAAGSA